MSLDAFSQAFAGTDWDKLAAARPAAAGAPAAATARTGLSGGDAAPVKANGDAAKTKAANKNDDGFLTFNDVLDIINPLQHIPIIDAIYRRATGDTIRPQGQILGDFLFGGLIGGAIGTAAVLFTETTGVDPLPDAIAFLMGDDKTGATETAAAQPAQTQPAAAKAAPAARSGAIQTAAATARPIPLGVSAETTARRNLVAANQSALQLLAQDLAAGGQLGQTDPTAPQPQPPARAQAQAQPQPQPAPQPQAQPVQAADAGADAARAAPGRMPSRGLVGTNTAMPRNLNNGRQYAAYTRTTPVAAANPGRGTIDPQTGLLARQPAPAAVPAPAPAAEGNRLKPLAPGPTIRPLNAADGVPVRPLDPAAPVTGAPPVPAQPLGPEALGPDGIQALMMRNLEKYQAMSRSPGRIGGHVSTDG